MCIHFILVLFSHDVRSLAPSSALMTKYRRTNCDGLATIVGVYCISRLSLMSQTQRAIYNSNSIPRQYNVDIDTILQYILLYIGKRVEKRHPCGCYIKWFYRDQYVLIEPMLLFNNNENELNTSSYNRIWNTSLLFTWPLWS